MTENIENLILEYLSVMRADIASIKETLVEHGRRLLRIETELGRLVRDRGEDMEDRAHLQAKVDRLNERIDRIERRLDLQD